MHSVSTIAALPRRDRIVISTCLGIVSVLAWLYLVHLDRQMSVSMDHETMMAEMGMSTRTSWTTVDILFTFIMWAVMMAGMMAGTTIPVFLLFAAAHAARGERRRRLAVPMFGLGYMTVWLGFSGSAALAQWALHETAMLSPAMTATNPHVSAAILLGAGAYQMTPWKGACLTQCRSPLGFLMTNWRDGQFGALRMGVRHGAYCLGCCWALMSVLFVVGVMNLVWVAALTAFVLLEKTGPAGIVVARVGGAAMMLAGLLSLAGTV